MPGLIDKNNGILYSIPIMRTKLGQGITILLALVSLFFAGIVMAGPSAIPMPDHKPVLASAATDIPIPTRKPEFKQNVSAPDEDKSFFPQGIFSFSDDLSSKESALYREIFRLQHEGKMTEADQKIKALDNGMLMGHVLAQRYLHPATRTDFTDLKNWLDDYNHLPQASRIYDLAQRRKPSDFSGALKQPSDDFESIYGRLGAVSKGGKRYKTTISRTDSQNSAVNALMRDIRTHVQQYEPTAAAKLLKKSDAAAFMDTVEKDRAKALIAAGYLYAGKLGDSLKYSNTALNSSGQYVPIAGWVAGLSHWQRGQYKKAASAFEVTASSQYSSGWMISAAGYWASRAHMRAGNVQVVSQWLRLSASYPRTFYGLIATRALGQNHDFDWARPEANRSDIKKIESTAAGARAKALIETGQLALAERELRSLYKKNDPAMRKSLLAYAYKYDLPNLTFRLANAVSKPGGGLYDAALYPIVPWEPSGGYKLDKALIHAFMRQESQFNASAESHSGATGLMQLMPGTASHVAGNSIYKEKAGRERLKDPRLNLKLGQSYLSELLNNRAVGQDLLSLAVAYNAGPGKLSKWKRERKQITDPLMFIETIPYAETRAFVERVLSNYWIYSIQMGQPTPSLEAVAEGRWARYAAMDNGTKFAEK